MLPVQNYPAARVPAKPLGEDGILNQNPIFEMGSKSWIKVLVKPCRFSTCQIVT
jgi:hypothetical protein